MTQDAPSESQVPSPSPSRKQGVLLELAKKRLASVDAKSDGKDDGDEELRQEALKFIDKECLSLPDEEFMKLLLKIENVLKRKDTEIGTVRNESKTALKEISDELSLLPVSNFDPNVKNPAEVAEYLRTAMFTIDARNAFMDKVDANPECSVGLMRNWNDSHPVRKTLVSKGFEAAQTVIALDRKKKDLESYLKSPDGESLTPSEVSKNRKEAKESFQLLIKDGFPDVSKKETGDALASVYLKGGQDAFGSLLA